MLTPFAAKQAAWVRETLARTDNALKPLPPPDDRAAQDALREYQRQHRERAREKRMAPPTVVELARRRAVQQARGSQVQDFLADWYRRAAIANRNRLGVRR